jgi:hypothetical protein
VKVLFQTAEPRTSEVAASDQLLQEFRCTCGKLLFKGLLVKGIVEIKCKRCQDIKRVSFL